MINKSNKDLFEALTKIGNEYVLYQKQNKRPVTAEGLAVLNSFIAFISKDTKPKKKTIYDKCIICYKIKCICGK